MDDKNVKTLLDEEIKSHLEAFGELEIGADDYKSAIDGVVKLMDRKIEMEKLELEHEERVKARESENKQALAQREEERKDRIIKDAIAVAGIVIPSVLTIWGTIKSLKFEEEGSVTTIMGRGFINKLLPKK